MAESVVFCVMERLGSLLVEEAQLLSRVRYQVEQIQGELQRMRCFLKDADARQNENVMVCNWVAEIRELAHDTEDVLEMYAFKIPLDQDPTFLGKFVSIFRDGVSLHQVESEIQRIRTRMSGIITSMQDYGIKQISGGESPRYLTSRRSYHHNVEQDFVGLDDEVDKLVAHLTNHQDSVNCHKVVSICGMGGLGKSTIARKIYHHDGVKNHFQAFAWASISQNWKLRDVLEGLLSKLSKEKKSEEIKNLRIDELIEEVYRVQMTTKCLVVLDDIWSFDFWEQMQHAFPTGNSDHGSGSKVIITTRNREVTTPVNSSTFIYELRCLNPEESWELLKKKAFPRQYSPDPNLAETTEIIGREMSVQCGGLPLAIITLGGILANKSRLSDWEEVNQNLNLNLRTGRGDEQYGVVYEVLALSYNDLPYHLKHCFLQTGIFPEDYRIPARKLIQLWAAEGFIPLGSHHPGEGEETMMDVGERYLGELAKRYMVQVQVDDSTRRFKSCRLHDLMRDVCLLKGKEENFLKILPHKGEHDLRMLLPSASRNSVGAGAVRRLSVIVSEDLESYFPPSEEATQRIRTALFFCTLSSRKNLQPTLFLMCTKFRLLRTMDLENSELGKKLPKVIGNLVGLRFMSFRNCELEKLSSSVGNLKYLQTLDLRVKFFSNLTIPNVLWKLQHLRHLYLPPSHGNTNILLLESFSKLETLKNFDSRFYDFKELMKLPKLQKLSATLVLQESDLEEVIRYLNGDSNNLKDIKLLVKFNFKTERDLALLGQLVGCCHLRKLDLVGSIRELPHFRLFSPSLTSLTLRNSLLIEDPMATLEKLPTLSTLALRANAFAGKKMRCSPHGFPQLKTLHLEGLLKLKKWKIEEEAMLRLAHLEIDGCENLRMVPDGLKNVTSMKELMIANMPDTFSRRLKVFNEREGEDLHKIQHIPSVVFRETRKDVKKLSARQITGEVFSSLMQNFSPNTVPRSWQTM